MVRTDKPPGSARLLIANLRSAMAANVPKGMNLAVIVPNDDERIVANGKGNVIARIGNFASMSDEQPAAAPDAFELGSIHKLVGVELARKAAPLLAQRDKI